MMKIQKHPDYLIFAQDSKSGELLDFPDVSRGWGITIDQTASKPPMEWMNGAFNRIDKNMLYLLQQGVPEWSEQVFYPVNAIIKYNGIIYIAKVENESANPVNNVNKWTKLIPDASTEHKGIVQLSSAIDSDSESQAATSNAIKIVNDKLDEVARSTLKNTGGTVTGTISVKAPVVDKIITGEKWKTELKSKSVIAAEQWAIFNGSDWPYVGESSNITIASWWGVGFAPLYSLNDQAQNNTVAIDCRAGTVSAKGGFYDNGVKVIKQGDRGLFLHQQPCTKINDIQQITSMLSAERLFVKADDTKILPSTIAGYLLKVGARDVGGGGLYLFCEYIGGGSIWMGTNQSGDQPIIWNKIITDDAINSYLPVGIPQPWPSAIPPAGWLKCDGTGFDKNKYPLLAKVYPNGRLPDLRGEFIRGWDNGREVDIDRNILTAQSDQARNAVGFFYCKNRNSADNALIKRVETASHGGGEGNGSSSKHTIDFSNIWPTGDEFRPRNVAFMYIVKAA